MTQLSSTSITNLSSATGPATADRDRDRIRWGWPRLIVATLARSLVALICSLALWAVLPTALGWQPTTVVSGSMQPRVMIGDVAVAAPTPVEGLRAGQLLLFPDPDHAGRLRLHRFVGVDDAGLIITRGDANTADDSTHVDPGTVDGVARLRVPYLGLPIVWWHEGRHLLVVGLALGLGAALVLCGVDRGLRDVGSVTDPVPTHDARGTAAGLAHLIRPVVIGSPGRGLRLSGAASLSPTRRAVAALLITAAITLVVSLAVATPARAAYTTKTSSSASLSAARYFSCDSAPTADGPSQYWKLDETSGTTAADASGNGRPGTYVNGFTTTTAACGRGSAATLNGTTQYLTSASTTAVAGPTTFSIEAWFRTSRGGMIANFGNARTGNSGQHDRKVYVTEAGRVYFGVYPGTVKTVASGTGYADNRWHHVVATLSGSGMRLYLDGTLVASDSSVTTAESFNGFWRFGYDTPGGWPEPPTSGYLAGSLDNVAVYATALTAGQVADHYAAR